MVDISLILAAYNGVAFINESIQSVLNQKGIDLELIIIDDASTDSTLSIIERFISSSDKNFDSRIRLEKHKKNHGILPSYAHGISLSKAPYFKIIDQDDTLPNQDVLLRQKQVLDNNQCLALVSGRINLMDKNSKIYTSRCYVKHSGVLDKKKALKSVCLGKMGLFKNGASLVRKEAYYELNELVDIPFVIKTLVSEKWGAWYLNEPVLNYRTHQNNATNNPRIRCDLIKRKLPLAKDIYGSHRIAVAAQRAYWTLLEVGKMGYSKFRTKR